MKSAYGDSAAFRDQLTQWGLAYAAGVRSTTSVWPPAVEALPPMPTVGRGRPSKDLRCAPGHQPVSVKALAMSLPESAYQSVSSRAGTNDTLASRFAAVRVRTAHKDSWRSTLRPEEWLLIEWPAGDAEPLKYFLSTLPENTPLDRLVFVTKMRWRIERDYRELKQEFGLGHYEGRNWRGLHHHATLCIAAYGFLLYQRLTHGVKKTSLDHKRLPYPKVSSLAAAGRTQRHAPDSITTLRQLIAARIARQLMQCPCCGTINLFL